MARRNLKGMFWLLVAIAVVTLPLACSSSSSSPTEEATDATTAG
ncbi:MAG TPA: hypothetical protein VEK07_19945 [Polyangiaceae bacterium]|nr:hypothetical protein [Polyangiaceae bacterium]